MKIYESETYRRDLDEVLSSFDLGFLRGRSILITGASGLIGSTIIDLLLRYNETDDANVQVYAAVRTPEKAKQRFSADEHLFPVAYDALKPVTFDFAADYIIHTAGNASPDKYINDPVGTMMGNINGIRELLEYGLRSGTKKTLYLSSSEVYGRSEKNEPFTEQEYGYADILNIRSSYIMGKRASETLCASYASQFGSSVVIARPGHVYGPTAGPADKRVSSLFPRQAANGEDLVMKSEGRQLRSYCYCVDCASAILAILKDGVSCEAYNISNRDSVITIRQMAELVAAEAGVTLTMDLPTGAEKAAFNPMENSSLNSDKLEALGWHGLFPAEKGFGHTVDILKETL